MIKPIADLILEGCPIPGLDGERGQMCPQRGPAADVGNLQLAGFVRFLREVPELRRLRGLDTLALLIPP